MTRVTRRVWPTYERASIGKHMHGHGLFFGGNVENPPRTAVLRCGVPAGAGHAVVSEPYCREAKGLVQPNVLVEVPFLATRPPEQEHLLSATRSHPQPERTSCPPCALYPLDLPHLAISQPRAVMRVAVDCMCGSLGNQPALASTFTV